MNVIERINMLKKMVKEVERIVAWQSDIYTALHNIDATWVVSGVFDLIHIPVIDWARISANFPRTIADLLSDHNLANHPLAIIPVMDWAHISGLFPRTIADLLSDHNLANHPLAIIPVMDDGHIPNLETLSYGGAFAVAQIPGLPASQITSGQFPLARMPRAASGLFLEGDGAADPIYNALIAANIPNLDAAKITTGTFPVARGGTGLSTIALGGILYASALNVLSRLAPTAANQVLRSTAANALQFAVLLAADIPALDAAKITSGQFPFNRIPRAASGFLRGKGVGVNPAYEALVAGDIPNLDAAKIVSGTFPVARGGTGLNTIALGGILYASALDVLSRLAPTAANQVLRSTAANALQFAVLLAADIPNLDAAKITSGAFILARIPNMDWAHISGLFPRTIAALLSDHNLANHPLAIIPVMDDGHIPNLETLSYGGAFAVAQIPGLPASQITSGQFPLSRMPRAASGLFLEGNGAADPIYNALIAANIPNLDAAKITTGVFALARIPNMDWAHISALFPRTIAALLSDHDLARHVLGTIVPHDALASLTERAHSSLTGVTASQHHTKYTHPSARQCTTGTWPWGSISGKPTSPSLEEMDNEHQSDGTHGAITPTSAKIGTLGDKPKLTQGITAAQYHELFLEPSGGNHYGELCILPSGTENRGVLSLYNTPDRANYGVLLIYILGTIAAIALFVTTGTGTTPDNLRFAMHVYPESNDAYSLGESIRKWSDIYAVNTHWGDLGFADKTCPKCGEPFNIGDEIILKVIRLDERDGDVMTIPIHFGCARRPPKTIKRNIPQFTTEYSFIEGRVVKARVPLKQKRIITNGTIKRGYDFDKNTGTFSKNKVMKEGYNRTTADKYIKKGEARDGYSYDPKTKKYANLITGKTVEEVEACVIVPEEEAVIPGRPASLEEATEDKEVLEVAYKEAEIVI